MTAPAVLWPGKNYLGQNYPGIVPVGGVSLTYPTTHAVYFASRNITLKWGLITNANAYHLQVCANPDFSAPFIYDQTLLDVHKASFTDNGADDAKRYWRWRYSLDGGASYGFYSEVGSYWMNTAGTEDVNLSPVDTWALINPSPVTDRYLLPDFPLYSIAQKHLFRIRERNRLGTLLSEYITQKGTIQLVYNSSTYLTAQAFFEIRRFNEQVKTFFIATFKRSISTLATPNIWKVQFDTDPELAMFAPGRQDLFAGTLNLTEV